MCEIYQLPIKDKQYSSDLERLIDEELELVPESVRGRLKFELVKTIDSYDGFFTEWPISLPQGSPESLRKQIYDIARQEHERKMLMIKDIIKLKIVVLVAEYQRAI